MDNLKLNFNEIIIFLTVEPPSVYTGDLNTHSRFQLVMLSQIDNIRARFDSLKILNNSSIPWTDYFLDYLYFFESI